MKHITLDQAEVLRMMRYPVARLFLSVDESNDGQLRIIPDTSSLGSDVVYNDEVPIL